MTLETWALFCATELVLCFIPGPAVLYVVSVALARGARSGLGAACGILAGNSFYFALSATGVAALILASGEVFLVLKWIGAAYLVVRGVRMLAAREGPAVVVRRAAVRRSFVRGFAVQAANPKALVFFVALLPQFVSREGSIGAQLLVLGVTSLAIELFVLGCYVLVTLRARRMAGVRFAGPLERVGGGLLVAAGTRLAFVRSE